MTEVSMKRQEVCFSFLFLIGFSFLCFRKAKILMVLPCDGMDQGIIFYISLLNTLKHKGVSWTTFLYRLQIIQEIFD